jgi:hypothetical protein
MRSMKYPLLASLLFAAIGCGGSPAPTQPDAGSDRPAAVTIASITPADGATKVSLHATITIKLSGAADAASINADTVRVYLGTSKQAILGAVSYDAATGTITFTPAAPMICFTGFTVDVKGVTAGGVAVPEGKAHFRVLDNPARSLTVVDDAGVTTALQTWKYDDAGRYIERVDHTVGDDGKLGTTDDGIAQLKVWHYQPSKVQRVFYSAPGPDGAWRTADDLVQYYSDSEVGAIDETKTITYTGAGADKAWFTADDVAAHTTEHVYDDADREVRTIERDGKGQIQEWLEYQYDGAKTLAIATIDHDDAGADKTWLTADDDVGSVEYTSYDARGRVTGSTTKQPGDDAKPGTSDDVMWLRHAWEYNAAGDLVKTATYNGAGPDGVWGNADDYADVYDVIKVDAMGMTIEDDAFETGADSQVGTPDDYKASTFAYETGI